MTRGIENCNPGNIRLGKPMFQGEINPSRDDQFRQFISMPYGIRAIAEILLTYQRVHKLYTIRQIINRWAPPEDDNPTDAYIMNVADRSGFDPDAPLNMLSSDDQIGVITGIIDQEQGGMQGITEQEIASAVELAVG